MKRLNKLPSLALTLCIAFGLGLGCDDSDTNPTTSGASQAGSINPDGLQTGDGPCEEASECGGDVCVAVIDGDNPPVYCTEQCTPGSCPSGMYCDEDLFALLDMAVCRFGDEDEPPPNTSTPPEVVCQDDADCEGDLICAQLGDIRGCAVPCDDDTDCDIPPVNGVQLDLAVCGQEDGGRQVCVGDPDCYPDLQSCVDPGVDIPGGGG